MFFLSPPLAVVTFKQPVKLMSVAGRDRNPVRSLSFLPSSPSGFSLSDCIFLLISDYAWKRATLSELSLLLKRAISSWTRLERTEKEPWPRSPRAQLAARPGIFSCLTLSKSLHSSFIHSSEVTEWTEVFSEVSSSSVPFYWKFSSLLLKY